MLHTAIRNIYPTVVYVKTEGTINDPILAQTLDYVDVALDISLVTAEVARLQAEYDANAYARSRKAAYDALNQLELISDDAINGTTTHKDAILAIKAEFPKP